MARAFWLIVVLAVVALAIFIPVGVRARYEGFAVPSASMAPTLLPGDYILVDKSVRSPERGDMVVFADAADEHQFLVKRVIGLSGEDVHVKDRLVYVGCRPVIAGCRPLPEPYADFGDQSTAGLKSGDWDVPPGAYFVMADNRNAGEDSRHYGPVRWQQITGRPFLIYWSTDPSTGTVRWERLGRSLR